MNDPNTSIYDDYSPELSFPDVDFPIKAEVNPSIVTYRSGKTWACAGSVMIQVPTNTTLETLKRWVVWDKPVLNTERVKVQGSKGNTYTVTRDNTQEEISCSCPGFKYRDNCKHLKVAFP